MLARDQSHGVLAVLRLADDVDTRQQAEQHHEALADGGLVVRDDDARAASGHVGILSSTCQPSAAGPRARVAAEQRGALAHADDAEPAAGGREARRACTVRTLSGTPR